MLKRSSFGILALVVFLSLAACSSRRNRATPLPVTQPVPSLPPATQQPTRASQATPVPTEMLPLSGTPSSTSPVQPGSTESPAFTPILPTPTPPKLLTVCLGSEPQSLFLYQALSPSARSVLQAIYDGPFDVQNFDDVPVILENKPTQANGDITFAPVEVQPGESIVDDNNRLTTLQTGVIYRPSGCSETACAQVYSGDAAVTLDQMVVRFRMIPGLLWSDSTPLTADDSVYSFEVASSLYPFAQAERILRTASYQAIDELTVEWRGLPGFVDPRYPADYFSPLPRHAWGNLPAADLLQVDATTKTPLGWGPYVIDQWITGDHITLHKNPVYFRASEGLPYFDNLVFRFVDDTQQMLDALATGECDLADSTAMQGVDLTRLLEYKNSERLQVFFQPAAWEMAMFGIVPYQSDRPDLFGKTETRQAIAECIDRSKMASDLWDGQSMVLADYVLPMNPLYNPDVQQYAYDPARAAALLEAIGWRDTDGDPSTPRLAEGIPGVPDGTPFVFTYLVSSDAERPQAAQILVDSLAQCGIDVRIEVHLAAEYLSAGRDSPVFGRQFDLAQLAMPFALEPSCELFTSTEIPGPYPEYPLGWGGANAAGYSNPDFDRACRAAGTSLPESALHQQAHFLAQAIFANDLPVLPLYLRLNALAARPDLCGLKVDDSTNSALWNLETWVQGENCEK